MCSRFFALWSDSDLFEEIQGGGTRFAEAIVLFSDVVFEDTLYGKDKECIHATSLIVG